jgi:hypothetical protein
MFEPATTGTRVKDAISKHVTMHTRNPLIAGVPLFFFIVPSIDAQLGFEFVSIPLSCLWPTLHTRSLYLQNPFRYVNWITDLADNNGISSCWGLYYDL